MEKQIHNYCVYKHEAPNGKIYIGITSNKPEIRWNNGKGYKSCRLFYNAIIKYGWDNITHDILFKNLTKTEAEQKEQELIKYFNSNNRKYGYNLMSGGHSSSRHSIETRQKMSESHSGVNNWNYGRKHTEEERIKIAANRIYKYGADNPSAKPILQYNLEGNLVKRWGSIKDASLFYCKTCIKDCLKGKYKQHKGFVWKYESEVLNG